MDEIAERHLEEVKQQTVEAIDAKYRAGHREHNGNLLSMSLLTLLDEAILEATDQIIYLRRARERAATLLAQLEETTNRKGWRDQQNLELMAENERLKAQVASLRTSISLISAGADGYEVKE